MRCSKVPRLISKYQDGELGEPQAREMREHLAACQSCRMEESALRETLAMLSAWPAPEPKSGYEAVLSRVGDRSRTRAPLMRLPMPGWAVAGLAVLSIAGGSMLAMLPSEPPGIRPSRQQVASAMDLHSFNDVLEASVASAVTTQPSEASEKGGVR